VDDEFREAITLYGQKLIPILKAASNAPLTLIHGDIHTTNIFFDTEFRGSHVTLIDWPSAAHAKGVTGISCLAIHSLTVNMRRTIETNLLGLYHNTLVSEGGTGYSIEQCQADYRSGFLYPFYFKVMVLAFMDLNDEEGRIMAHMQIERISAAIRDHNLVGLLRAM